MGRIEDSWTLIEGFEIEPIKADEDLVFFTGFSGGDRYRRCFTVDIARKFAAALAKTIGDRDMQEISAGKHVRLRAN